MEETNSEKSTLEYIIVYLIVRERYEEKKGIIFLTIPYLQKGN